MRAVMVRRSITRSVALTRWGLLGAVYHLDGGSHGVLKLALVVRNFKLNIFGEYEHSPLQDGKETRMSRWDASPQTAKSPIYEDWAVCFGVV